jgi:hypothetical protein
MERLFMHVSSDPGELSPKDEHRMNGKSATKNISRYPMGAKSISKYHVPHNFFDKFIGNKILVGIRPLETTTAAM